MVIQLKRREDEREIMYNGQSFKTTLYLCV